MRVAIKWTVSHIGLEEISTESNTVQYGNFSE